MVVMIAETGRTKMLVTMSALIINLNATVMADVYLVLTNVTGIRTVLTDPMKMTKFVVSIFLI